MYVYMRATRVMYTSIMAYPYTRAYVCTIQYSDLNTRNKFLSNILVRSDKEPATPSCFIKKKKN